MRAALFIVALLQSISLISQNLVPNPSFEFFFNCPTGLGQFTRVQSWTNPTQLGSPDYYNRCDSIGDTGVPVNFFDSLNAHSGNAYMGIGAYSTNPSNGREYIQTSLSSTLDSFKTYYVSLFICLAKSSQKAVANLGCYFSETETLNHTPLLLSYLPQLETNPNIPLINNNWIQLRWQYTASGHEKYLVIGNFRTDQQSIIVNTGSGQYDNAYYFIDDVCVSLNPADCGIDTNTTNVANVVKQENEFKIFPNPAKESLSMIYLVGDNANLSVTITNVLGQEVLNNKTLSDWGADVLNINALTNGIYFLKIMQNGQHVETKKFLIEK